MPLDHKNNDDEQHLFKFLACILRCCAGGEMDIWLDAMLIILIIDVLAIHKIAIKHHIFINWWWRYALYVFSSLPSSSCYAS